MALTVATPGVPLDQTPPGVASTKVVVPPTHTVAVPVIGVVEPVVTTVAVVDIVTPTQAPDVAVTVYVDVTDGQTTTDDVVPGIAPPGPVQE